MNARLASPTSIGGSQTEVRILMLSQFYSPVVGGEETLVRTLARGLVEAGHHVAIATLQQAGLPVVEDDDGIRIHRLASTSGRVRRLYADGSRRHLPPVPDPEAVAGLRRVVRQERPNVVHAHNWLVRSFLPIKAQSGARLVVTLHDYGLVCATRRLFYRGAICSGPAALKCIRCASDHYGPAKGSTTAIANRLMRSVEMRAADLYLPISDFVALAGLPSGSKAPRCTIPNLIGESTLAWDAAALGPPPTSGFLMFAGDLVLEKGVHVLLDAYRRLNAPPELLMVGRVEMRLPATAGVRFLGPLPHAATMWLWRACSIAVVPSTWLEPFGLVALEAMTLGRPVVASRIGGLADIVKDEITGIAVPPGDPVALAAALQRLIDDPELAARLGQAGRLAAHQYSLEVVVPRVEAAYRQVLAS
jgi:glycosyltransferase involved in cell wall biosynthesis